MAIAISLGIHHTALYELDLLNYSDLNVPWGNIVYILQYKKTSMKQRVGIIQ